MAHSRYFKSDVFYPFLSLVPKLSICTLEKFTVDVLAYGAEQTGALAYPDQPGKVPVVAYTSAMLWWGLSDEHELHLCADIKRTVEHAARDYDFNHLGIIDRSMYQAWIVGHHLATLTKPVSAWQEQFHRMRSYEKWERLRPFPLLSRDLTNVPEAEGAYERVRTRCLELAA